MYYWEYFKYVIEHKSNVWRAYKSNSDDLIQNSDYRDPESIKRMKKHLKRRALLHDLSKFNPVEFIPYAKWFNGPHGVKFEGNSRGVTHKRCKENFKRAVKHHYTKNPHHWNHWVHDGKIFYMPEVFIIEMILDWIAMSYKFGGTPQEWYLENYNKLELDHFTRISVERALGLNKLPYSEPCSMTTLKEAKESYKGNLNDLYPFALRLFNIDLNKFDI